MRVLVCGGRNYSDYKRVCEELSKLDISLLIQGGAKGADYLAKQYALILGIPVAEFPAAWDYYQRGAGPIRNGWMLEYGKPDLVVAFPGERGTANMVGQAMRANVKIQKVSASTDAEG